MPRLLCLLSLVACTSELAAPVLHAPGSSEKLGRPTSVILGAGPLETLGREAAVGDFDGDGYGDVALGSQDADCGPVVKCGKLWVHRGGSSGLDVAPAQAFSGSVDLDRYASVVVAGDFDGDGFDDLALRNALGEHVQTLTGSVAGLVAGPDLATPGATSFFGWSMSTGDANGDGFDDLLVGDPFDQDFFGQAALFLGSATGLSTSPATTMVGAAANDQLGYEVAFIGDVDGDGLDDAAVRVPDADDGGVDEGKVQIHHGSASGLSISPQTELISTSVFEAYGRITAAGDVNGDGYDDMLVGRPYAGAAYEGRVDLFLGDPAGLAETPAISVYGSDVGGLSMSWPHGVGDLDGDGYDDVALKFDTDPQESALAYFLGGPGLGIDPTDVLEIVMEPVPLSEFGTRVVTIDTDDDARPDTVVTAYVDDTTGSAAGAAYYFTGDEDLDEDGFGTIDDCDDDDPDVHPGIQEVCNQVDDDCNGLVDDGLPTSSYGLDLDEDGYTHPDSTIDACDAFDDYVLASELPDCNDVDATTFPGAVDIPNDGIDQDCDGVDEHTDDSTTAPTTDPTTTDPTTTDTDIVTTDAGASPDTSGDAKAPGGCGCDGSASSSVVGWITRRR